MSTKTPLTTHIIATLTERTGFRIPPPLGDGEAKWYLPNESVVVAGKTISCGLIYVGTSLKGVHGWNDPALIDPTKPVATRTKHKITEYGPSNYSQLSQTERRVFLEWLAGGRNDPNVETSFLMLFLYGLERRVILDATQHPAFQAELPVIEQELRRLLDLCDDYQAGHFQYHANALLEWIFLSQQQKNKLYLQPPPPYRKLFRSYYNQDPFPIGLLLALGQVAVDKVPIPAAWAHAWATVHPDVRIRSMVVRHPEYFSKAFDSCYHEQYGAGIKLSLNKTPLEFEYQPASPALRGLSAIKLTFGKTPDISTKRSLIKQLQKVVDAATEALAPYYRYLGKYAHAPDALEGLLLLPLFLLPENIKIALQDIQTRVAQGTVSLSFASLLQSLNGHNALNKNNIIRLAEGLQAFNVGIEPDVLHAAKPPKMEDMVVLFAQSDKTDRSTLAYLAAQLTIQLSALVAKADDTDHTAALDYVQRQLQSWTHLTPDHQRRLDAQLSLLPQQKVTLAAIKKQAVSLPASAKTSIANFLAVIAQFDGSVSPAKIKLLEKIYPALDLETNQLFSDLHAAESGGIERHQLEKTGFALDAERIAELQRDTARVSILLADIFREDEPVAPAPPAEITHASIMGLDEVHSILARRLLARPEWTRIDLLAAVADLNLMLDGALEHLNEAAFDEFDCPFTEGCDPITLTPEILESLTL